jgi:hypothetical protein
MAYDTSDMTKETLERLTFSLCHYYFNWAGPIKVPAPCMYAHKLAELHMYLRQGKDKKYGNNKQISNVVMDSKVINSLLHYL